MSLVQINLHTEFDNKYKDLYVEIKNNTTFNDVFNKIKEFLNENNTTVNLNKIVLNDNLFINPPLDSNFLEYLNQHNIEYYELDDLSIICFINTNLPELISCDFLNNIYKKHITN
jgi:hypothetical protein